MRTRLLLIGIVLLSGVVTGFMLFRPSAVVAPEPVVSTITTFEECKNAGYPIMESYPEQCRTPEGQNFVREIVKEEEKPIPVPKPVPTPSYKNFDTEITMRIAGRATFSDGFVVDVEEISDSRCKSGVQCIWAGEITTLLRASGGTLGTTTKEVRLGTTNNKMVTIPGYEITLSGATTADVTIVVTKNIKATDAPLSTGYVKGSVTIGPLCPVERVDKPCPVPPETYTSRNVIVYEADQATVKSKRALSATGSYSIALAPGTYWVQIDPAGIGEGEKKQVSITAGNTENMDFDIDTGIR
jgi:hypothetical protein